MATLPEAINYLRPGCDFETQVIIVDDGTGSVLTKWLDPRPRPTDAEIAEAMSTSDAAIARANMPPVSRAQLRLELHARGLLAGIDAAISASNDEALKINWQDRQEFRRTHPLIVAMLPAVGISDTLADEIFTAALAR